MEKNHEEILKVPITEFVGIEKAMPGIKHLQWMEGNSPN